jgi:hypothetical protein
VVGAVDQLGLGAHLKPWKNKWSERQDLNLRRLGPKPSALARLSYAPTTGRRIFHNDRLPQSHSGETGLQTASDRDTDFTNRCKIRVFEIQRNMIFHNQFRDL